MVKLKDATWTGVEWRLRFRVYEGVYHEEAYPMTLTYLGPIDGDSTTANRLRTMLSEVAEGLVRGQMRLGSLPPRGMLSNWREIMDRSFATDRLDPIWNLMQTLDESLALILQSNGHGYYQARKRGPESWAPEPNGVGSGALTVAVPENSRPSHVPDGGQRAS